MKPFLNPEVFKITIPESERELPIYWVTPPVLAALLNPESTLLAAPSGYGKSTLALIARQQLSDDWFHVRLKNREDADENLINQLLSQITQEMWSYIEEHPAVLAGLQQTRAVAARYFLQRLSDIDINFLLARLAEDEPDHAEAIEAFRAIQPGELFSASASNTQRLSVLCDCVQKLGSQGIFIWIDLSTELAHLSHPFLQTLQSLFDSLHLMRRRTLHIKCLALPSVCRYLQTLRGVETLSVNRLTLQWTAEQMIHLIEQRLTLASAHSINSLAQLVAPAECITFLESFSDVGSPVEWLTLARLIVEKVNATEQYPLSQADWLSVRRSYCVERVKLRLDEQGSFWRGKQLLTDLTPKKRALYPLLKYLYEHPGVHRTYTLTGVLDVDETNLNTMVSRVRKEHLEPFLPTEEEGEEAWIYLVTDFKGGGYTLVNTLRSP